MNMAFYRLSSTDIQLLQQLMELYADVFETEHFALPAPEHLQSLLNNEQMIFLAATANDIVVGGITAHVLPSVYSTSPEVYIYDVAVARAHQRQGVGKQLLQALKAFCTDRGYNEMFVQADIADQHALDFYRTTGGNRADVVHYTYNLE